MVADIVVAEGTAPDEEKKIGCIIEVGATVEAPRPWHRQACHTGAAKVMSAKASSDFGPSEAGAAGPGHQQPRPWKKKSTRDSVRVG